MSSKWLTVSAALWLPLAMIAEQPVAKPKKPPATPPAARPAQQKAAQQAAMKTQAQAVNQEARAAQQALNAPKLPGGLTLERLSAMSPDERAATLANLPPARQQLIEQKVENYQKLDPEQKARVMSQYNRFQSLPPDRIEDVRQSLKEYAIIPGPRKTVIAIELGRIANMTDEQRSIYMSKPGFRGRFSESEIQMMNNLRGIVP